MSRLFKIVISAVLVSFLFLPAYASHSSKGRGFVDMHKNGRFEDVYADLQDAIINRGLVIDYVGHLDQMLERTSEAVGSVSGKGAKSPYKAAKFLQFCSSKLSHEVVSANPTNIAICPFVVFVYELRSQPGVVTVGYRKPISGPSKLSRKAFAKIEKLLNGIIEDAVK